MMSQYKDCPLVGKFPLNYSVPYHSAAYSSCQLTVLHTINTTSRLSGAVFWFHTPLLNRPSGGLAPILLLMTSPRWGCLISSSPIDKLLIVDWIISPLGATFTSSYLKVLVLALSIWNLTVLF